ncbi:FHA domain-containing protein [Actinoalloteichus hymeniacidonis]|uniref:FHA domain-containing protein n=1 Tax=Actinoalloteichus hymeniacidonis TaxID=340345 RepID=A0AAC9HTD4_9PSEU|nr:FHA domain-containing protein [Actinoalloteichus hymeniacidonis]AOS64581.1 FHA domain-containing protein [Actinoalloteichus hymeniacidonis]MBB5907347.1 hypothetical protein [Actinoalloteichus hymeniacidonis]
MARAAALRINSPDGTRANFELNRWPITVGRAAHDSGADVKLGPDPQRWVGRLHCTLDYDGGLWWVTDNSSVNGTLVRQNGRTERLRGRRRLHHGDVLLVLGDMTPDGAPLYWELIFLDPHTTRQAPFGLPAETADSGPSLRYDWVAAKAYRVEGNGSQTLVEGLRPKGHQLVRYMAGRSSDGAAVACDHAELITALWGPREEWAAQRAYNRMDIAGVVHAVRLVIEIDPRNPRILETVTGIGYRLNVSQSEPS